MAAERLGHVTLASALDTDTRHWTPASPVHSRKQWGQSAHCASVYLLHMLRGHLLTLSLYPHFFPTVQRLLVHVEDVGEAGEEPGEEQRGHATDEHIAVFLPIRHATNA